MRGLKTWAWAVVIAATAAPASAQLTTGSTGSTGSTGLTGTTGTTGTGNITGTSSRTTSSTGSSLSSGNSLNSGSNSSNGMNSSNNGLSNLQQSNSQYTNIGITGTSSLQKSNVFASFYVNPYAMGLSSSSGAGGFGQPLYGTSTTGSGRTGAAGATGRSGLSNSSSSNQSGILIPLPAQIAYSAQMQFPTPRVATPRLQADLRGIIDAGGLSTPSGVQVVADANNNVTLRGTVKDDDEKRLAEGLVRLTPGVGTITNELSYPVASK